MKFWPKYQLILLSAPLILALLLAQNPPISYGQGSPIYKDFTKVLNPVVNTITTFEEREEVKTYAIPYSVRYEKTSELEWGVQNVSQGGKPGTKRQIYKLSYWRGILISKKLDRTETEPPNHKVIQIGTKKVYRSTSADKCGKFSYYGKLNMWATSYDSNCRGCSKWTSTGMRAGYGVVAVDPRIIPLHSKVCVPGYGIAVAGDTGGAIKGMRIDLGFDDVRNGWWSARSIDVYLLE